MTVEYLGGNRSHVYVYVTFGENSKFANKVIKLKGWLYREDGQTMGGGGLPSPQNNEKPTFYFNLDRSYEEALWWAMSTDEVKALFLEIYEGKSIYRIVGEDEVKTQFPNITGESIYGILSDDPGETHLLAIIGKSVYSVDSAGNKKEYGGYFQEHRTVEVFRENEGGSRKCLGIRNKDVIKELSDLILSESKNGNSNYYLEETCGYFGL